LNATVWRVLTVRNNNPSGTGGGFVVNGLTISPATEGVTNRAAWTGTFFRSLPVPVRAVPDAGYVFDGWVGTAVTNPAPNLFVGETPITLTARFRLTSAPAYVPTGYERWQMGNYGEAEVLSGVVATPAAPSGCAGLSNFALYACGLNRFADPDIARARAALSIHAQSNALWVGYARLNNTFTDVRYTLKVASDLRTPVAWSNALTGVDLEGAALTNTLDASTWFYEVRLLPSSPTRDTRFFTLESALQ
jgi:uncharacterized repeat protein (TIGR02543 family)